MKIAILALQGAFLEHEQMLQRLGIDFFEVRQLADWQQPKDGLIIPGGESTTMGKLLFDLGLQEPIQKAIREGLPVFGTCAGLILLAKNVEGDSENTRAHSQLAMMDITANRNAYGRQLGSFYTIAAFKGIGNDVPMTFIRAPFISKVSDNVEVLSEVNGNIVAAREGNMLVTSFHPELDTDTRIHEYFIKMI
ncbi:pyridoxal 5'-phosphate synthase glutaminase subunit PdxT [Prevotella bivia]|uniref:pyridoxal 5'-phosphate synthase glutaminase subunit PdxT n=1 Tax=Prevotella bivia TaxID=28125 RepID=UPI00254C9C0D|nr:pyridoxal 5'-phosphate synthase glutaminase subunit PdxT [Prevotella bivia]MDK7762652.1 pyridoxal 5'-phosphate synthase glutaminase subunit PdxT [Prevotella bivia]